MDAEDEFRQVVAGMRGHLNSGVSFIVRVVWGSPGSTFIDESSSRFMS